MADFQTAALSSLLHATPTSSTLFHYTSQEGLLGIVDDKALRISSIRHLSDATEFDYALELGRRKLNQKLRAERGPWNTYYGTILERLDAIKDMALFVGSFSEAADLLSQWRAYSPNGGFSIGLEYEHLKAMAESQGLRIMKCVYEQQHHEAVLEDLINRGGRLVKDGDCEDAVLAFFIGLYKFAPALKHPAFSEEQEWRIVSDIVWPNSVSPRFRAGRSMLIPYQEFKLAAENQKMPISKIIIGPTPHMQLSTSSVQYLLTSSSNVDPQSWTIAPSQVPYRSW